MGPVDFKLGLKLGQSDAILYTDEYKETRRRPGLVNHWCCRLVPHNDQWLGLLIDDGMRSSTNHANLLRISGLMFT